MARTIAPSELKRKGTGLNQLIAKTHKLGGQLLGLQITNGNLIAVIFSATQITAGIVVFGWQTMSFYALLLIPLCAPLAILIERLSLGGLMVFRTASAAKVSLEDDFFVSHLQQDPSPKEQYEYKRRLGRLKQDWWMSLLLILLGVGISGYVGDQFWQTIFKPVGEPNSTLLSLLIASSVSLTFVFSELYSELSNKGIKDAMMDNQISEAVLSNAEVDLQLELSMEAFGNLRSDPHKRSTVVRKIEDGLTTRLLDFADRAQYLLTDGEGKRNMPELRIEEEKLPELPRTSLPLADIEEGEVLGVPDAQPEIQPEIPQISLEDGQPQQLQSDPLFQTQSEIRRTSLGAEDGQSEAERTLENPSEIRRTSLKMRRDYKKLHAAFDEYIESHSDATLDELMRQFEVKRTTLSVWRQAWRSRKDAEGAGSDGDEKAEVGGDEVKVSEGVADGVVGEAEVGEAVDDGVIGEAEVGEAVEASL